MRKKIAVLFAFLIFFGVRGEIQAAAEFTSNVSVNYKVGEEGITTVVHNIDLVNNLTNIYATSYTLSLQGISPINPRAEESGQEIPLSATKNDDGTVVLKVDFPDPVVGKGNRHKFKIIFEDNSLAIRTGEVWEIVIPKLTNEDSFNSYFVNLEVPQSFGPTAYISPDPVQKFEVGSSRTYAFSKELISKRGVTAAFGQFQVFSFDLTYHLENPLSKTASIEVAIPPDTAFQKVFYQLISPEPQNVKIDQDGNWIVTFGLKARERVDVVAKGSVQIFSKPAERILPTVENLSVDKAETEFRQVNDPQIKGLAQKLKTPKAIYDYVVNTLTYDYDRVKPNVSRLGAKGALENPKSAICMEFTDLFIALVRSAGIPAREVNGYAYTENPEIQPLSLVADVLHAWPEYWDNGRQIWVPVDPTWGNTTGGVDFFSKFDLRHFTFVIHGKDATKPFPPGSYKLGPNPQKDVFVSFGQLPEERSVKPLITIKPKPNLPLTPKKFDIEIKNTGPVAIYDQNVEILLDDSTLETKNIAALPSLGNYKFAVTLPFFGITSNIPNEIKVLVAGQSVKAPTFLVSDIIVHIVLVLLAMSALTFLIYFSVIRKKKNKKKSS